MFVDGSTEQTGGGTRASCLSQTAGVRRKRTEQETLLLLSYEEKCKEMVDKLIKLQIQGKIPQWRQCTHLLAVASQDIRRILNETDWQED